MLSCTDLNQTISIWKPLRGPVRDWPLALCDVNTLDDEDIVAADLVYPATVVENCLIRPSLKQKWYYLSNQTDREAWIFVQSDSKHKGQFGQHTQLLFCHAEQLTWL